MSEYLIDHNPRCSKSRAALAILREHNIEPIVIDYLQTPLDVGKLRTLLQTPGLTARDILRDGKEEFRKLRLADPAKTETELLAAVAEHPILLQRPIIECGPRAIIARPTPTPAVQR